MMEVETLTPTSEEADFLLAFRSLREHLSTQLTKAQGKKEALSKRMSKSPPSTMITCNVGGTLFPTTLGTFDAAPNSLLYYTFRIAKSNKVPRDSDGNVFFDRCGSIFYYILNYLRNPSFDYLKALLDHNLCKISVGTETIERLFEDMEFYGLDEMQWRSYWVLELSGTCQSIHPRVKERCIFLGSKETSRYIELPVVQPTDSILMGKYRFEPGPGVSSSGAIFSQSTAVAFFHGGWMPYQDTCPIRPYATPFPGIYYVSVTVESIEGFGIGIVSPHHDFNCEHDFCRTKHCAKYDATQGKVYSSMCVSLISCMKADSELTIPVRHSTRNVMQVNVDTAEANDIIGIQVNFFDHNVRWMLNGMTMCLTPLCPYADKLRFAVLGKSRTAVRI